MTRSTRLLLCFLFLCLGKFSYSQSDRYIRPYQIHNMAPFVHSVGIKSNLGGVLLKKNQFLCHNSFNIVNNSSAANVNGEIISLDGEMYRNEFSLSYGLTDKWEFNFTIPLVAHTSGFLDESISTWHSIFHFPETARRNQGKYAVNYNYFRDNRFLVQEKGTAIKLSDISLSLGNQIYRSEKYHLVFRLFYKQKIGSKQQLVGSGTNDYGVHFNFSTNSYFRSSSFSTFSSLGFVRVGGGALLGELRKKNILFGSLGLAYKKSENLFFKGQIDFHSAPYKSSTKQLGKPSMQITLGCDYFISDHFLMTFAFAEDLIVNTAPDFIFHFGTSYYF